MASWFFSPPELGLLSFINIILDIKTNHWLCIYTCIHTLLAIQCYMEDTCSYVNDIPFLMFSTHSLQMSRSWASNITSFFSSISLNWTGLQSSSYMMSVMLVSGNCFCTLVYTIKISSYIVTTLQIPEYKYHTKLPQ